MTAPIVGPRAGLVGSGAGPAWAILAGIWGVGALAGAVWAAGRTASALTSHRWAGPPFGTRFVLRLLAEGPAGLWPGVPVWLVWGLFTVELAAAGGVGWLVWSRVRGPRRPGGLAGLDDLDGFHGAGSARRAAELRPTIRQWPADTPVEPGERGVLLGAVGRTELRASWEDVGVAIMAPRSGKTTALAVPAVLDAPGAVLVTSNKADLWAATARTRGDRGAVWVFDPQQIARTPQAWWWDPLAGLRGVEDAQRLASHFTQEIRSEHNQFWSAAAADLLTGLFLAAASAGRSLADVCGWLVDSGNPEPVRLLQQAGDPVTAASLKARQTTAGETREGIFENARTATQALRNPQIMAWVTPPAAKVWHGSTRPCSSPAPETPSTCCPKTGPAPPHPLVAALADTVLRAGTGAAEAGGGRLDPPLVVVLDEAANICKIRDLPALYSHLGSRGISVWTILQSRPQGRQVWGRDGFDTLWGAATIKLVGAGIDDPELLEDLSKLVGDTDIDIRTVSHSRQGPSQSLSVRRQRVLPPETIRALPKGQALLFATGTRPALIDLRPWYRRADATQLQTDTDHAVAEITRRAQPQPPPPVEPETTTDGPPAPT